MRDDRRTCDPVHQGGIRLSGGERIENKTTDLAKEIFRNTGDGSNCLREAAGVHTKQSGSWFPSAARRGLFGIIRLSGFWAGYATAAANGKTRPAPKSAHQIAILMVCLKAESQASGKVVKAYPRPAYRLSRSSASWAREKSLARDKAARYSWAAACLSPCCSSAVPSR
jgi:hypothetical protein